MRKTSVEEVMARLDKGIGLGLGLSLDLDLDLVEECLDLFWHLSFRFVVSFFLDCD